MVMEDVAWKWVRIGRKIRDLRRFGVFKCRHTDSAESMARVDGD